MATDIRGVGYLCADCGSAYVHFDAYAYWDADSQRMELDSTSRDSVCGECGLEGCIEVDIETYKKARYR
jgi:DNA-directed RNA polymerase subunit RPC12/RpoP